MICPWNSNTINSISFSVGKISFIHLIVPLNFNIDQNTMRRGPYAESLRLHLQIYRLKIKILIEGNT